MTLFFFLSISFPRKRPTTHWKRVCDPLLGRDPPVENHWDRRHSEQWQLFLCLCVCFHTMWGLCLIDYARQMCVFPVGLLFRGRTLQGPKWGQLRWTFMPPCVKEITQTWVKTYLYQVKATMETKRPRVTDVIFFWGHDSWNQAEPQLKVKPQAQTPEQWGLRVHVTLTQVKT